MIHKPVGAFPTAIRKIQPFVLGIGSCGSQETQDFIVPDPCDFVALKVEVRVQERIGAVEIQEADAEVVKGGEDG